MSCSGYWVGQPADLIVEPGLFATGLKQIRRPLYLVWTDGESRLSLAVDGRVGSRPPGSGEFHRPLAGVLPPLYPEWLGDRGFLECHGVRLAYAGGAMARGIASARMVIALGRAGMLGFFGSAGLSLERVAAEIEAIRDTLDPDGLSWGVNLIHTPDDPQREQKSVALFLTSGVRRVEAAAFMGLTPALVHFACQGLRRDKTGRPLRHNYVFAKVSRPEVARGFMEPPPADMLRALVANGSLTPEEAGLAAELPVAEDLTVEADSAGHTDNRPLPALFLTIAALRDAIAQERGYIVAPRLGAAGGLGAPAGLAAAFALGAAYVVLGTVHQVCVESGLSQTGKVLLGQADVTDVTMTPSADMFELGANVQVLKKGTLMGIRGVQLQRLYARYPSLAAIPVKDRRRIEKTIFRQPLETVWKKTCDFLAALNPAQVARAEADPKLKMALVFRWYLGNSSRWAVDGDPERIQDYQIWCGPAIGAFNQWCRGSFLEHLDHQAGRPQPDGGRGHRNPGPAVSDPWPGGSGRGVCPTPRVA